MSGEKLGPMSESRLPKSVNSRRHTIVTAHIGISAMHMYVGPYYGTTIISHMGQVKN